MNCRKMRAKTKKTYTFQCQKHRVLIITKNIDICTLLLHKYVSKADLSSRIRKIYKVQLTKKKKLSIL